MFEPERTLPVPVGDLASFVLDRPQYDEDKPIYIDAVNPSRSYSIRQARSTIRKLVAGFRALGLKPGECVLINSMADINYSILFLGIIAAGGIWSGSNPFYTASEATHQIKVTNARFIFTESEFLPKVVPVAKKCGLAQKDIFVFDHGDVKCPDGFKSWQSLFNHGELDWQRITDEAVAKKTIAAYVMSSGTTGLPKAVVVSHHNFLAEQTLAFEAEKRKFEPRHVLCLPQFAAAAVYTNHVCPLRGGEVSHVMRRFNATEFIQNVERYKITELTLLPPMIIQILQHPLVHKNKFKTVKYVHGGAAPIGKGLQQRMMAFLPKDTPFTQRWGMSETCGTATCLFWPEYDDTASIGRLIPNLRAKLIDDEGKDISAYDTRGELCIKGPTVMVGYLNNDVGNASTFDTDGWLKTGDICYCDSKTKKWYIVDRKKELIKVHGFQVAPAELEEVLLGHPGIADAAVIGIDAPELATELPRAYVVRGAKAKALTEDDIKSFVSEKVIKYKRLDGGVVFVDSIPKAPSGKILKNPLREKAKGELAKL